VVYNVDMSIKKKLRWQILRRDRWTCQYCGRTAPFVELDVYYEHEIDHKQSKKDGGKDTKDNLVTACFECNRGKGAESLTSSQDPNIISRLIVDSYITILKPIWQNSFPNSLIPEGKIRKALYFLKFEDIVGIIERCGRTYSGLAGTYGLGYQDKVNAYFYGAIKRASKNFTTKP